MRGGPAAEVAAQGTFGAVRRRATERLAHRHDERVQLVEERGIGRQVLLEERARLVVAGGGPQQAMPDEHAARVRVGNGYGTPRRVEENRVDGLRAEAGDREQFRAERPQGGASEAAEAAAEAGDEPGGERAHAPRL